MRKRKKKKKKLKKKVFDFLSNYIAVLKMLGSVSKLNISVELRRSN